jgi:hypothetical protein
MLVKKCLRPRSNGGLEVSLFTIVELRMFEGSLPFHWIDVLRQPLGETC